MPSITGIAKLFREAASKWVNDNATRLAAAVAFYSILSLAPLLVLAVAIAGLAFGNEAAQSGIVSQARGLVGDSGAEVVRTTLANAKKSENGTLATVIGIGTLLLGASGVFVELHDALNTVWNVRSKRGRGFWNLLRTKLLGFGMVLSIGFLLLVLLVINTVLAAFGTLLGEAVPRPSVLTGVVNFLLGLVVEVGLFALIFRYLPDVRMPWKAVWFGAAVTAVLFTLGKYAIGAYLAKAAVGSPFGAAGSLVALVVWIYYSALIVFLGAEVTEVHARHSGSRIVPTAGAEWISKP
ncbi:MAG TPA: YihY/virulence factor BrkB family protein [Fimbriiglobus sp.]|jgi:membrane protein